MSDDSGEVTTSVNPANPSGVQATLFTQDQVNHFNAEAKRGALNSFFKELGFDAPPSAEVLKSTLSKASEFDKLQEGQKSDVERLTGELGEFQKKAEQLSVMENQLSQARIAADLGLKPRYWKYVEGSTDEEIKSSVQSILQDVRTENSSEDAQQQKGSGSTRRLEPNPQQGRSAGTPPARTLTAGAEAYRAKHKKE